MKKKIKKLNNQPPVLCRPCKVFPYLLAKASWASIAVFRPRKAGGLADLLRLFLRTFSVFFFRSLIKSTTVIQYYWQEGKWPETINALILNSTHLLWLRLLLWWRCLVLEPDRDLAFFFLSRLRDCDRRLSLLLLWWRLKSINMNQKKILLCMITSSLIVG